MTTRQTNPTLLPATPATRLAALACALILASMLSAFDAFAQDAPAPPAPPQVSGDVNGNKEAVHAKSTLRGHVAYEGTGRPVRRARVMLLSRGSRGGEVMGVTNSRGDFQIKNVPEGKYFIMVDAAGVVTPLSLVDLEKINNETLDYEIISKQFEEVSVDGINDKEVEVRAQRGGAISGRVTYQDGDPAVNVRVTIMRRKDGELQRFLTSVSPSVIFGYQTDDRGIYRFAGLPPGEYVVGATENIEHGDARRNGEDDFMGAAMFGGNSLVMTYYQDATNARDATSIKIAAGAEEKNVDITLADRPLHTISGTVRLRREGRPLAHARLTLTSKENSRGGLNQVTSFEEFLPSSETNEMGQWSFNEIPDGQYVINVQPVYQAPEPSPASAELHNEDDDAPIVSHNIKKFSQKQQDIKVAGHDVTDLSIEMTEGGRVSGTVTVEGGKPAPGSVFISAQPLDGENIGLSPTVVSPNGHFTLDGLPGGKLYLYAYMPETGYYTKSILANGVDLLREPLLVQESAEINGVSIVISADSGTLAGRVLAAPGGAPLGHTHILLYPMDSALWARPGTVISDNTDEGGAFSVKGAPGEYLFIVLRADEKASLPGEDFIKARAASAPHVTLQANEQRSVEIIAPGMTK
jgi:hypothetical protein